MLTVRALLDELGLRLLAGENADDAPVRWVHMSELADPTPWLSGGEVLLTTGMGLSSDEEQRAFIDGLADRRLAALGFGVGFGFERVPEAVLEAARARDFPLFEIPFEVPFIAITEFAFTHLVNEHFALLQRALRALERLERIVLSQRGLAAVVAELRDLLGASVLMFDRRGVVLAGGGFERAVELGDAVRERIRRRERRQFMPVEGSLALPVAGEGSTLPDAWLVAVKDGGMQLTDFDRLLLRQAVTIVALELLRAQVAVDTERRLAGDVLAAIAAGDLRGADLARRLEPFGLADEVACLVSETEIEDALRADGEHPLVATVEGYCCALIPGRSEESLLELATRVTRSVDGIVGVGRSVAGGEARRAFLEARCALEAVLMGTSSDAGPGAGIVADDAPADGASAGGARLATYRDLGAFQLLLALQDDEALQLYCDSILGVIERSEGSYGGELIRSLEAFIEENGQWERAARRLFCHRHTLRYRIRKVEELTGRDLGLARDRIEIWLALRGRELVRQ